MGRAQGISGRPSSLPGRFSELLQALAHIPEAEIESAWEHAPAPGTVIGRFELVREIGRGGFGVVYEALDRDLGRAVAFKFVLPGKDLAAREERLLREAESAARLSHPNIVTLFDVGRSERGPYLVLELLRGKTLADRLRDGPVPAGEALRIAVEVAKGVAHAHANGIVHRDLTPRNVFLCDDGQVKVLDLGMAHAFGHRRVGGGTPGYMAPEQRRGAPEDERTDVFTLGAMLYRMLAGEPAFSGTGTADRPAPGLDVTGAPGLGALVASMLEEDPVKRPRDAGAVLPALAAFHRDLEHVPSSGKVGVVSRARRRAEPALVVLVAAAAGLAVAWGAHWLLREPSAVEASIAVLPFADLSPERDQEHFSDGLAEEILAALARVDGLRVPGRTSSFFYKGKNARLEDIGRELKVAAVLEGSVRRAGNRVRVTAQVVNVRDGYQRWARTYDRELNDIFALQGEIARSVAEALEVKLLAGETPMTASHATSDPEVYAQYLIGRQQYHLFTREGFRGAVEAYERALARDASYAPAWAGLAPPLFFLSEMEPGEARAAMRRRALAAAERAVELAPELSEALAARGMMRANVAHDWAGAEADLKRAVASNPHDADTRRRHAILLGYLGKHREAIAEVQQALEIDPLGPSSLTLAALQLEAGELADAEAAYRRQLERSPDALPGAVGLARTLLLQRRPDEALAVFEGRREEDYRLWVTAVAEHERGNRVASDAALDALVARHGATAAVGIAEVHAWRGDVDAAFTWLERAVLEPAIRADPFLASLRGDPRFAALLRKIDLPAP